MRSPRPMHRVLGYRSLGSSNVRESPASSPVRNGALKLNTGLSHRLRLVNTALSSACKYSNADALHRSHSCAERSESRID